MALDLTIAPIHSLTPMQRAVPSAPFAGEDRPGVPFADFLSSAIGQTIATDADDKITNVGLMVGDLTDLHTATIAATRAEITLGLMIQVRNKMVESYQEVMRMQV